MVTGWRHLSLSSSPSSSSCPRDERQSERAALAKKLIKSASRSIRTIIIISGRHHASSFVTRQDAGTVCFKLIFILWNLEIINFALNHFFPKIFRNFTYEFSFLNLSPPCTHFLGPPRRLGQPKREGGVGLLPIIESSPPWCFWLWWVPPKTPTPHQPPPNLPNKVIIYE